MPYGPLPEVLPLSHSLHTLSQHTLSLSLAQLQRPHGTPERLATPGSQAIALKADQDSVDALGKNLNEEVKKVHYPCL